MIDYAALDFINSSHPIGRQTATHPHLMFSNILPEAGNENVFAVTKGET